MWWGPLSSEYGTRKTVRTRLWPWFLVKVLKTFQLFLVRSEAARSVGCRGQSLQPPRSQILFPEAPDLYQRSLDSDDLQYTSRGLIEAICSRWLAGGQMLGRACLGMKIGLSCKKGSSVGPFQKSNQVHNQSL